MYSVLKILISTMSMCNHQYSYYNYNLIKYRSQCTSLIDRILLFFANEVELAIQKNDNELLTEIGSDLKMLQDYVLKKFSV